MIPSQFIEAAERAFFSAIAALRSRWKSAADVRHVIATQLDPLLKAADELEGKLRSHAVEDFIDFREMPSKDFSPIDLVNLCSTLYLFAQFWARLEILRRESFNADLAQDSQGKVLLRFLRSLESKRVRLVDRAWQRAIGESLMVTGRSTEVLTFKDFVELYEVDPRRRAWL